MYRAVTLAALEAGVALDDEIACAALARKHVISVEDGVTTIDGRDVSAEIRGPEVTAAVSAVSAHPEVRSVLVAHQRAWVADHGGGVVEGRDIGTVVFPAARLKVFLTASDDERARRRQRDEEASAARRAGRRGARRARATRRARQWSRGVAAAAGRRRDRDRHDRSRGRRRRGRARRAGPCSRDRLMLFYRMVRPLVTGIPRMLWRVRVVGQRARSEIGRLRPRARRTAR